MDEDFGVYIKTMNFKVSFETNDKGELGFSTYKKSPLTRRVLIEKYLIRNQEIDWWGEAIMASESIYEEPGAFDKND